MSIDTDPSAFNRYRSFNQYGSSNRLHENCSFMIHHYSITVDIDAYVAKKELKFHKETKISVGTKSW